MSFAAPVVKDRFVFNGDLYIEVENFNRHKRASIPELTALLRPAQKLSKSALSAAPADQVGHWYEAQLLHYGLPPSKTKAVAKVRLLDALNAGKLSIPPEITRLENEMKKEYQAADRKARAAHKAQLAAETKAIAKHNESGLDKKRKLSDETPAGMSFNIQFNIGAGGQAMHMVQPTGAEGGQPAAKKAKKSAKVEGKEEKKKKAAANPTPKQPAAKKVAATKLSAAGSAAQGSSSASVKPRKKQTAVRTLGPPGNGKREPDVMRELALKGELESKDSAVKQESTSGKPAKVKEPVGKKEPVVKKEPQIKKELKTNQKPTIKQESMIAHKCSPTTPIKKDPAAAKSPAIKQEAKVKKEPKVKTEFKVKNEPKAKAEPKVKAESKIKPEPKVKKEPKPRIKKEPKIKAEPKPARPNHETDDSRATFWPSTFPGHSAMDAGIPDLSTPYGYPFYDSDDGDEEGMDWDD